MGACVGCVSLCVCRSVWVIWIAIVGFHQRCLLLNKKQGRTHVTIRLLRFFPVLIPVKFSPLPPPLAAPSPLPQQLDVPSSLLPLPCLLHTNRAMRAGVVDSVMAASSIDNPSGPVSSSNACHCEAQPPASVSVPCRQSGGRQGGEGGM